MGIEEGEKGWAACFVYYYTNGIITILSSANLFVGVNAKKSTMLLAWLVTMMVYSIAFTSLGCALLAMGSWPDSQTPWETSFIILYAAFVLALALFIVYCYAVVVSFYMELKESKKHADSESTPLMTSAK